MLKKEIGFHVDRNTRKETRTKKATIVYSKTGTHITPRRGDNLILKELYKYEGKRIKLTDVDGDIFTGKVCDSFEKEDNSPDFKEDAIALYHPIKNGIVKYSNPVCLNESEIAEIELID